jgi:hypothetical protein
MNKQTIELISELENSNTEDFRYYIGIDFELSDKSKKNLIKTKNINFKSKPKVFKTKYINFLKNKSDLISLIKNSIEGLTVNNLTRCYSNIKKDLLDLVKFKEKSRIIIMIKGKTITSLSIFPYSLQNYIPFTLDNILSWYK